MRGLALLICHEMKSNGLPRSQLIKSKSEIGDLLKNGRKKTGAMLNIYEVPEAKKGEARFAFLCGSNIKKATQRNFLKRIIREIVRINKLYFQNRKTIFLVKESAGDKTYWQIRDEFVRLSGIPQ